MSVVRDPKTVHQSDPGCLALVRARADGVRDESEAAKVGTATHAAAEALTYACTIGEHFEPMAVVTRAVRRIADEEDMAPESVSTALAIMERLIERDQDLTFFTSAGATCYPEWGWGLDEDFAPLDPADDSAAYAGTVDHLRVYAETGKLVVLDYKSILKMPAEWELPSDWQARVYSLAVLANFPNSRAVTFRLVLLRHGYWIEHTFRRGDPWEASTRARLRIERERRLTALATDEWPERLGVDCKWCPIIHRCGAQAEAREQGAIPDMDPSELARRAVGVKALASSLDRSARELVEAHGPIPLGDGSVLGRKPVQRWALAASEGKVLERLRWLGMTFEQEIEWFAEGVTAGKAKDALRKLFGREWKQFIESGSTPVVEPVTEFQHAVWWPEPTD